MLTWRDHIREKACWKYSTLDMKVLHLNNAALFTVFADRLSFLCILKLSVSLFFHQASSWSLCYLAFPWSSRSKVVNISRCKCVCMYVKKAVGFYAAKLTIDVDFDQCTKYNLLGLWNSILLRTIIYDVCKKHIRFIIWLSINGETDGIVLSLSQSHPFPIVVQLEFPILRRESTRLYVPLLL